MVEAKFSQGCRRSAAFLARGGPSEIREKSLGEGESWGTETREPATLPMQTVSMSPLGGSGFDFIEEANTFPSVQCGLCVVHIIGFQDVKMSS